MNPDSASSISTIEAEITDAMLDAGIEAYGFHERVDDAERAVRRVYAVMEQQRRAAPPGCETTVPTSPA